MTIEMCSKRRVRNREGVETDVVNKGSAKSAVQQRRAAFQTCIQDRGHGHEYPHPPTGLKEAI